MLCSARVNPADLLFAISYAMDLASPELSHHQLRTAYIVWRMGEAAGLAAERTERVFIAAALHDIGAFSPEEKLEVHRFEQVDTLLHCRRGEILLKQVPWLAPSAGIVRHHHRRWSEWESGLGAPDVLESQLLLLADTLERNINRSEFILHQREHLVREVEDLADGTLHGDVIELFHPLSRKG
jgi:HD-GYP domain-containing protein (c-di-GMP phosphodiesterase class II)